MQTFHPLGNRSPLLGLSGALNSIGLPRHRSLMSRSVLRPLTSLNRFPLASHLSLMRLPRLALDASSYQSLNLTEWTEALDKPVAQTRIEPRLALTDWSKKPGSQAQIEPEFIESSEQPDEPELSSWSDAIVDDQDVTRRSSEVSEVQLIDEQEDIHRSLEVSEVGLSADEALLEAAIASERGTEEGVNEIESLPKKQKTRKARSSQKTSTQTKKKTSTQTKRSSKKAVSDQTESLQTEIIQSSQPASLSKSESASNYTERIAEDFRVVAEDIEPSYQELPSTEQAIEPSDFVLPSERTTTDSTIESFNFESPNLELEPDDFMTESVIQADAIGPELFVDRRTETTQEPSETELQRASEPFAILEHPTFIAPELPEQGQSLLELSIDESTLQTFSTPHSSESLSQNVEETIESPIVPIQEQSTVHEVVQRIIESEIIAETIADQSVESNETAPSYPPQIKASSSEPSQFNHLESFTVDDAEHQLNVASALINDPSVEPDQIQESVFLTDDVPAPSSQSAFLLPNEHPPHSGSLSLGERARVRATPNPNEDTPTFSSVEESLFSESSELPDPEPTLLDQASTAESSNESEPSDSTTPDLFSTIDVPIQGYAIGGIVTKTSTSSNIDPSDTVPAMLSPGEFVIKATAAQKHLPLLHHLNQGGTFAPLDSHPQTSDPAITSPVQQHSTPTLSRAASYSFASHRSLQSTAFEDNPVTEHVDRTYASPNLIFRSPAARSSTSSPDHWNSIEEFLTISELDHDSPSPSVQRRSIQGFAEGGEVISPPEPPESDTSEMVYSETDSTDQTEPSADSIDTLAQEIYQRLRQRLEIERERCGLYSGRLPW
ncbi:hypothetical protein H6F89_28230 [Cyanobacteria bacterium FACHB-63]|nr:hypothetical protein [Cyanobacteria bacterium FACHB-63]